VASGASGAWAGYETQIAIAVGVNAASGWYFREPEDGVFAWVQDEDTLFYYAGNSSPGTWTAYTTGAGAVALNDLTDVDVPAPTDGQVLTYDTDSPIGWKAQDPVTGATTLDGLTDVDTTGVQDGDELIYESSPVGWFARRRGQNAPWEETVACSDETTALTAGTAKITFRVPCAVIIDEVRASLSTAQTSGGPVTVDINESGASILSTKITIDNGSRTSVGSSPAPVISDPGLADDAEITIDIDNIGDGTAKGLKVTLKGRRA